MAVINNNSNQPSQTIQPVQSEAGSALMMQVEYGVVAQRMQQLQEFVKNYMVAGDDYGKIDGINKPTLLKSGAEKLCDVYGLSAGEPVIDYIRDDSKSPIYISYRVVMPLISRADGRIIMTGVGSCNSHEKKYKWRWVYENELPSGINPQTLKTRQRNQSTQYQIPNDEIDDLDNTLLKMAKKRALVDAVLSATRSSAIFTQDVEDMEIKTNHNEQRYEQRQNSSSSSNMSGPATESQIKAIFGGGKNKGLSSNEVKELAKKIHQVDSMKNLTKQQASDMITLFNKSDKQTLKGMLGTTNDPQQQTTDDPFADGKRIDISDDDLPFDRTDDGR
ncbi:hypothetical protein P4631_07775 [Halalkalibacterium halodurans]|uniref:hypothetical protein n=1 Tax=Halalkalibacterium halodurans TaxID=86665 RepID=UPI002E1CCF69|nr:hypothetical protein [Halalkalibacterium halodurans]